MHDTASEGRCESEVSPAAPESVDLRAEYETSGVAEVLRELDNERDYGQEAIEILLQVIANNRDDLVVIMAGYGERMEKFFTGNPGFRSWIAHHIEFPDYSDDELFGIAKKMLDAQNYALTAEAHSALREYIALRGEQPHFAGTHASRVFRGGLDAQRPPQTGSKA